MRSVAFGLLVLLPCLVVRGETRRISLPCRGGEIETYFLDLSSFDGKASGFRLSDDRGERVSFSFDFKLALPRPDGLYRRPADGFYSKESAPASENRFRLPGYFTFRTHPGVTNCVLAFDVGERGEWPKSDPSLRPWWIDLMSGRTAFRENTWTAFGEGDLPRLPDVAGRSLNVLVRAEIPPGGRLLCELKVPNARPSPPEAVHFHFLGARGVTDHLGEGVVKTGDWTLPAKCGSVTPIGTKQLRILEMSVQSPPGARLEGAVPRTDLAYVGDRLRFTVPQSAAEASFACTCGGLAAERLYVPRTRLAVRARLVADGGRILKEGFVELDLADVPPGVYRLETVLSDGDEELSPRVFRLTVRPSPWVTVGEKGTDHFCKPGCIRVENAIISSAEGEVG